MKYFIVLASLAVIAYGMPSDLEKQFRRRLVKYSRDCKAEIGASDDDVAPVKAHQAPTTDKGKCFVLCMNKKFGFQAANGKISKENIYAGAEKLKAIDEEIYEKIRQIANTCLSRVSDGPNKCETATAIFACAKEQEKMAGITPFAY